METPPAKSRGRYDAAAVEKVRSEWGPWCRTFITRDDYYEAALDLVVRYLEAGLPADVVSAIIRLKVGLSSDVPENQAVLTREFAYSERFRQDVAGILSAGLITAGVAATLDHDVAGRLEVLATWKDPIEPRQKATEGAPVPARRPEAVAVAEAPIPIPAPAGPSISLRDLFAEHSVLILASLGAFLLVVATVLFELYGTVGLGGGVRLAAVVALNLIFAAAGYLAYERPGLRSVGQIYIALAAALMPLVALAAWTFLELGARGITVDQALGVTGVACALVYGGLAMRLGLRAYGEVAGVAILAAAWGVSGWTGGDHWRSAGLALTPLAYGAWERFARDRVFSHFQWFAHFSALVALAAMVRFEPTEWLWTATLGTLAVAYLAWQALAPHESRAWIGEAALVLAGTAALGPLGFISSHFLIPMLVGAPMIALSRAPHELGVVGRLYRAHPAHLHLAVLAGFGAAAWENEFGAVWPLASALWFAFALYAADFWLGRTEFTGYTLRAALPLALAATGGAVHLDAWGATLTAAAGLVYLIPFAAGGSLEPLTRRGSYFFYPALAIALIQLAPATIGAGHWEITIALLVSTAAFAVAGELKAVQFAAFAARGLFSLAWFVAVDALNAQGWRGPFDALLAVFYTGLAQARALSTRSVATAGRRWFVHIAAAVALLLCFTGPDNLVWWRFAAAFGLVGVAYWWQALTRPALETPPLAWASVAMAAVSFAVAAVPWRWQGAAVVGAALLLTGAWAALRRMWLRPNLEESGFFVLAATVLLGGVLTLREDVPQWSQSVAALLGGGVLYGWSLIATSRTVVQLQPFIRSTAAVFGSVGVLLGAAVLKLDAAYAGGIALALAAGHAEWNVRTRDEVERWYAAAAMVAVAPVVFFWPYAQALPAVMAIELVALALLFVVSGVRRDQWFLAYPAALLLAPALHLTLVTFGQSHDTGREEVAMAILAWAVGTSGLVMRAEAGRWWAVATEAGAATIALGALGAMASSGYPDPAGIALLAYAPQLYTAAMQERERWLLPGAALVALIGAVTLLSAHNADTIYYAAALGVLGLIIWLAGWIAAMRMGHVPLIDMHRYLGLGLLGTACVAGFFFPDKTGAHSLGAVLASLALVVTGAVLWLDAQTFDFRPNVYLALIAATTAGYFIARDLDLASWQLVAPGLGLVACGVRLRQDPKFVVDRWIRRLIVAFGVGLVMGWAAVLTTSGDLYWLVVLLIEGAVTVGAGIVLRSRVLLAGGGVALALVSVRALLTVAQAGYLFAAFAAVALVLLTVATALALGRDRYRTGARSMREQLALWD